MAKRHYIPVTSDVPGINEGLRAFIRRAIRTALTAEGMALPCEINVRVTNDRGIHEINLEMRQVDAPTDVLSFPLIDWDSDEELPDDGSSFFPLALGDIVISLEKAHAQAIEYDQSLIREVSFLTIHSTLHLLGYDHETSPEDEKEMFGIQDIVIGMLGI